MRRVPVGVAVLAGAVQARLFVLDDDGLGHVRYADGPRPSGLDGGFQLPGEHRATALEASNCCVAAGVHIR